jgi:hypothetical protein
VEAASRHDLRQRGPGLILGASLLAGCAPGEPAGVPIACDEGLVDDAGSCVPEACGTGTWGDVDTSGALLVDPAAPADGDGSEAAPFATIEAALYAAAAGGVPTVALAGGTYVENLHLGPWAAGITVVGRCRDLVVLDGSAVPHGRTLELDLGPAENVLALSQLTLTGGATGGLRVFTGGAVLDDVAIAGNGGFGLWVSSEDGSAVVSGSDIGDTIAAGEAQGYGAMASGGASLVVRDTRFVRNTYVTLLAMDAGTTLDAQGVTIEETAAGAQDLGRGIDVSDGAVATVRDVVVRGSVDIGIGVGNGSTLDLADADVSDTTSGGGSGQGIAVYDDGLLRATRVTVSTSTGIGLTVEDGGTAELDDVAVTDTRTDAGALGWGIQVHRESTLEASDLRLERNAEAALVVNTGSTATIADLVVHDTVTTAAGEGGRGVDVNGGSSIVLTDARIEGVAEVAFLLGDAGTATLDGVVVDGVRRGPASRWAAGIVGQGGAEVSVIDGSVTGVEGPALYANAGGSVRCVGCTLDGGLFAVAAVVGGALAVEDSVLRGGVGTDAVVYAQAEAGLPDASLDLSGSTFSGGRLASVWIDGDGTWLLTDDSFDGTGADPGRSLHGNALFATGTSAWDGATGLLLDGGTFTGTVGPAVLLHAASATLADTSPSLWQQACEGVTTPPPGLDPTASATICPERWGLVYPLEWSLVLDEATAQ